MTRPEGPRPLFAPASAVFANRLILVVLILLGVVKQVTAEDALAFFEKKIRPVLVQHCYECHSAESDAVGGKLRLDSRQAIHSGGESGPALVARDPESSLILQALRYDGLEMPPDAPLPPAVVKDFEDWIASGAIDPREASPAASSGESNAESLPDAEALWSFRPHRASSPPQVDDGDWVKDPVDRFVLAAIERRGLKPAVDADPRTLARRLYVDLIGLPPTLAEIERFEQQCELDRDRAIESLVDQLLGSPQFGVRWGRHWLDVARYGESNGDDGLGRNATFPHAWRYRDYVIDAFNIDVPYDRFLTEQIAGDLLEAETAAQRNRLLTATGFLAIGSKPASAMNKNFAMDIVDDQINTVCTTVIGLSVACARCHDHKHDPIPTRDYYALAGIFRSTETLYGKAGNEKLTAPPTELHHLFDRLPASQPEADRTASPELPPAHEQMIQALRPIFFDSLRQESETLRTDGKVTFSADAFAATEEATIDGEMPTKGASYSVAFWFRNQIKNDSRPITAYLFSRAKWGDPSLPGDHIGIGGNHQAARTGKLFVFNGNAKKQSIVGDTLIPPGSWNHVVMVRAGERVKLFLNGRLEVSGKLDATCDGISQFRFAARSDRFAPLRGNLGLTALFSRALSDQEAIDLHRSSGQPRGLDHPKTVGLAMGVCESNQPTDCKIHLNGDGRKLGPVVPRGVLTAYRQVDAAQADLTKLAIDDEASGRLALARWLTRPDHPQTARVMVNRIWLPLFGSGIVATPDDFGVYGARPTHPELLDHLADRFIAGGWSIKKMIRAIVLSRTYQLDSRSDAASIAADPNNVWLARHHRRRLDAESLRDALLQASGRLDRSPGHGSAIETIDALINWPPGEATDLHRPSNHRSIYLCMLRHAPPDELAAFDLPDGVKVRGQRDETILPTQTLFLMNNRFVVEQAVSLADEMLRDANADDGQRVQRVFKRVLARHPSPVERDAALALLESVDDRLRERVSEPQRRRRSVWMTFCQSLMMTNEFRYID